MACLNLLITFERKYVNLRHFYHFFRLLFGSFRYFPYLCVQCFILGFTQSGLDPRYNRV